MMDLKEVERISCEGFLASVEPIMRNKQTAPWVSMNDAKARPTTSQTSAACCWAKVEARFMSCWSKGARSTQWGMLSALTWRYLALYTNWQADGIIAGAVHVAQQT